MTKRLILCDCLGTQQIDRKAIEGATGLKCSAIHHALCGRDEPRARDAISEAISQGDAIIACRQEQVFFEDIAAEIAAETGAQADAEGAQIAAPSFVDLRDRAGWSDEAAQAGPKMAALVADALLATPPMRMMDLHSDGTCLVLGDADIAVPVAEQLSAALAVTVLVERVDTPPLSRAFELVVGRLRRAEGTLGHFSVHIDALQRVNPAGRGDFTLDPPRDGARTACDIILDLRKGTPLFPAPHKRDGYLRADPGDPRAVARAAFDAAQLVGEFEKPLYVRLAQPLCAHGRAGIDGCSRCLDACPTGAIAPAGEFVAIDPLICAGCGACAALCPSGAIRYDAPAGEFLFQRLRTISETFEKAGGKQPRLLVHDGAFGAEMISLCARYDRGLPHDVIPFGIAALASFGHAEMLAALAGGFGAVDILLSPGADRETITREQALAEAIAGGGRIRLLDLDDPAQLAERLRVARQAPLCPPVLGLGSRRQIARLAARAIVAATTDAPETPPDTPLPLPDGAPYGAVAVDTQKCTLCLSCASLCPSGALDANPDRPQLRFQEDACLQCGICARACPEDAIALQPRMDLSDRALAQQVVVEEEPFACIECGRPFGVKSTVERIIDQLAGKHPMFASSQQARVIQMCDDCRVRALYDAQDSPLRPDAPDDAQYEQPALGRRDGRTRRDH